MVPWTLSFILKWRATLVLALECYGYPKVQNQQYSLHLSLRNVKIIDGVALA
jgi:hypothetical protein